MQIFHPYGNRFDREGAAKFSKTHIALTSATLMQTIATPSLALAVKNLQATYVLQSPLIYSKQLE